MALTAEQKRLIDKYFPAFDQMGLAEILSVMDTTLDALSQDRVSAQALVAPLAMRLETGGAIAAFADGTTDGWTQLSNKELALRWNNTATPTKMAFQFALPNDINDAAAVVVHFMGAIVKVGASEADSPVLTVEAYISAPGTNPAADTNCGGESGEFLTAAAAAWQEKTLTLAAADIPAAPAILTIIVNPKDGQLGTDDFVMLPPWLEITTKLLTS